MRNFNLENDSLVCEVVPVRLYHFVTIKNQNK